MATQKQVPFDLILALNTLTIDKSEEDKRRLVSEFNIDYDEYIRRIGGKEKEYQFVAIMKSLGVLKHLEGYDEELSHITNEYTPEYNIELIDGYKMMLEVKSTKDDIYEITHGNLEKRIEFASRHDVPLRFAVSVKGVWGLFTTDTLKQKNCKLTLADCFGPESTSLLDSELDTCTYFFEQPLTIKSVYAKNYSKKLSINNGEYGDLISYEITQNGRRVFRLKGQKSDYLLHSLILEALQDHASKVDQEIKHDNGYTVVTEKTSANIFIPEYNFLLSPIGHMLKGDSNTYNIFSAVKQKDFPFVNVSYVRFVLSELSRLGVNILVFRGSEGYRFEDYANIFWTKSSR
jgi:Holliday junction resolvase